MKEVMMQYGQSAVAVVVAVLLFAVIGVTSGVSTEGIYAQTGQVLKAQTEAAVSGNEEFERYWRLR